MIKVGAPLYSGGQGPVWCPILWWGPLYGAPLYSGGQGLFGAVWGPVNRHIYMKTLPPHWHILRNAVGYNHISFAFTCTLLLEN